MSSILLVRLAINSKRLHYLLARVNGDGDAANTTLYSAWCRDIVQLVSSLGLSEGNC